eukprot:g2565.t1 g2565   contig12:370233-371324(-)
MRPSPLSFCVAIQASFLLSPCLPFSTQHVGKVQQQMPPSASTLIRSSSSFRPTTSTSSLNSQILDFIEPTTGVPVKLIGAMHYNPASIKLATDTINELQAEGKLGSIIIESCSTRWNATLENEMVKNALQSEMRAAHDLGLKYNRPVVLGDQCINITVSQLKNGAKEALIDLVQPIGGWGRLAESIGTARRESVPIGDGYLGIDSFLDEKLLGAAPVSFVKYPLSYMVKSPVAAVIVLGLLVLSGGEVSNASWLDEPASTSDMLVSLLVSFLETVVFARVFLKELLAERNEVLAVNILEQCKNYQSQSNKNGWMNLFKSNSDKANGAIYARESVVGKPEEGKTVVAVLGLAHCNGIKKIMTER